MKNEEILIIKDPEKERYFSLWQRCHDEENEYSIILESSTELECATKTASLLLRKFIKLREILENFSKDNFDESGFLLDNLDLPHCKIKEFATWDDGTTTESFNAMIKNEDGTFSRFYR